MNHFFPPYVPKKGMLQEVLEKKRLIRNRIPMIPPTRANDLNALISCIFCTPYRILNRSVATQRVSPEMQMGMGKGIEEAGWSG